MYHRIVIVGNLGRDPEMRYTPAGKAVTTFPVAANDRDRVMWFRVTCWEKLAETCNEYLSKGRLVLVEGELNAADNGSPRVWTGNDGNARASFEVNARAVKFLGGGQVEEEEEPEPEPETADLPF